MRKITNSAELQASIRELELRTKRQEQVLKENAKATTKSFRPVNLVRLGVNNVKQAAVTPDVRTTAINTFVGLLAGFLSRKIVVGRSRNIFRRTIGAAVQTWITKFIYKGLAAGFGRQPSARPRTTARPIVTATSPAGNTRLLNS